MPRPLPILGIEPESIAARAGLKPGDRIVTLNGQPLRDVIDLRFEAAEEDLRFVVERAEPGAKPRSIRIQVERASGESLGIETEEMKARVCGNDCVFCFIDQMPKGGRRGLYVRDEDYRFSFLHGNYVTLTNLRPQEFDRILTQGLSPLYVSVHATDPKVRARLLGISDLATADVLPRIRRLTEGGIRVHAQVVLCPGLNDGAVLTETAEALALLHPGVESVAIVPLGLTKHRAGLPELRPVTPAFATEVLAQLEALGQGFRRRLGLRFVYPSDEWFFLTRTPIPPADYYQDFPQLEDGVGLARRFIDRVRDAGETLPIVDRVRGRHATVVTGVMAAPMVEAELVQGLLAQHARRIELVVVENTFLGSGITVAGLLAGEDIARAVVERGGAGDVLCLPPMCVNGRALFLDDLSLAELATASGAELQIGLGDEPFHTNPVWEKS
jgi:putative radical SAM enzyme (TIGR03279 family)